MPAHSFLGSYGDSGVEYNNHKTKPTRTTTNTAPARAAGCWGVMVKRSSLSLLKLSLFVYLLLNYYYFATLPDSAHSVLHSCYGIINERSKKS